MFCHIGYSASLLLPPSRSTGPTPVAQMNASLPLSCWDLKNRVQKRTERIVFMITHKNNEFTTKKLNRGVTMNFSKASIKQQNLARITNMQFTWFKTRKKSWKWWEQLTFFHKYVHPKFLRRQYTKSFVWKTKNIGSSWTFFSCFKSSCIGCW